MIEGRLNMLAPPFLSDQIIAQIIDARHQFAKKNYFDQFSWPTTDEIVAVIAKAMFGKFICHWFYTVKKCTN
jgi:hypothetical protein